MESSQTNYATCKCQNCDGGIEFDASDFPQGKTRTVECPHCHLETIIFAPPAAATSLSTPKTPARHSKKTASPLAANVLCLITVIFFFGSFAGDSWARASFFLFIIFMTATGIASRKYRVQKRLLNPPKPNWICANCGTLLTWELKTPPGKGDICGECRKNLVVPLATPRGQELLATYHGTLTAKERVEMGDEANSKLLRTLEPIPASGSLALELEKLANLVQIGAINNDEWQRAKALYLGQPKAKQQNSLARIQQLHGLCQSGALSESEFNMVKWDILAKGMG